MLDITVTVDETPSSQLLRSNGSFKLERRAGKQSKTKEMKGRNEVS